MYNIKFIRNFPQKFDENLKKRDIVNISSTNILKIDENLRLKKTELQELQNKRNQIVATIAKLKNNNGNSKNDDNNKNIQIKLRIEEKLPPASSDTTNNEYDLSKLLKEAEDIKNKIPQIEIDLKNLDRELHEYLITLPNILEEDVPIGNDEDDNIEVKNNSKNIRQFNFEPKQHFEIGEGLKQMDFEVAVKMSGSRFVLLKDKLAKLERALANFMLDLHTEKYGYMEISPPILVKDSAMFGAGQLPKFAEDSFVANSGAEYNTNNANNNNNYRLIPTAEVALVNIVADTILEQEVLPLRFTAYTPCFRSEAGSAGKDTRGMIRNHQFSKVELVSIVEPSKSKEEHERMLAAAEEVLKLLEIPYRVMLLCSKDTGFSSAKTYDIEVWLPGQKKYREISSCSNCLDFQAYRLKARFKDIASGDNKYPHTLNGSALAVGRTIVAILENYQQSDGGVIVPSALSKYMDGIDAII